ncbi:unnamed protein product [Rhodiola kirilowii]
MEELGSKLKNILEQKRLCKSEVMHKSFF